MSRYFVPRYRINETWPIIDKERSEAIERRDNREEARKRAKELNEEAKENANG